MFGATRLDILHFPHESTANQWFGEAQFESYRALGVHTLDEVLGAFDDGGRRPAPRGRHERASSSQRPRALIPRPEPHDLQRRPYTGRRLKQRAR